VSKKIDFQQILLVSQIMAQGTKVNLWEFVSTAKQGIWSPSVPNNKHLTLFVDLMLNLEYAPLNQSVFLHTL